MNKLKKTFSMLFMFSLLACNGGGGDSAAVTTTPATIKLVLSCLSAQTDDCDAAANGKLTSGGLSISSCSELLSDDDEDDSDFVYGLGTADKTESITCTAAGCDLTTSKWFTGDDGNEKSVTSFSVRTYTFAAFADINPVDGDGPKSGDLLFCKDNISIVAGANTITINDSNIVDPSVLGDGELYSVSCSDASHSGCSDAVSSNPAFIGGLVVTGDSCATITANAIAGTLPIFTYTLDGGSDIECSSVGCYYETSDIVDGMMTPVTIPTGDYKFVAHIDLDGSTGAPSSDDIIHCKAFTGVESTTKLALVDADADLIPKDPADPTINIACTESGHSKCDDAKTSTPSYRVGLIETAATCATVKSSLDLSNLSSLDYFSTADTTSCGGAGCSETGIVLKQDTGGGEEAAVVTPGVYALVGYFNLDDDAGAGDAGDIIFCKKVTLDEGAVTLDLVDADAEVITSSAISLSVTCTTANHAACSNAVVTDPKVSGGLTLSTDSCAMILAGDLSAIDIEYNFTELATATCTATGCSYSAANFLQSDGFGGEEAAEYFPGEYAFLSFIDLSNNDDGPDAGDILFCKKFTITSGTTSTSMTDTDAQIMM